MLFQKKSITIDSLNNKINKNSILIYIFLFVALILIDINDYFYNNNILITIIKR